MVAAFVPSYEFQKVDKDAPLPPGLEIKVDMDGGDRYARIAKKPNSDKSNHDSNHDLAPPVLFPKDLEYLQEIAHDSDHGVTVIEQYLYSLEPLLLSGESHERITVAKIIATALRNNPDAAEMLFRTDASFLERLVEPSQMSPGIMSILAALLSTKKGYAYNQSALESVQKQLGDYQWTQQLAAKLRQAIVSTRHVKDQDLELWQRALEAALPKIEEDSEKLILLQVLVDLKKGNAEFEGTQLPSAGYDFVQWIAGENTRKPQRRDADETNYLSFVREVRHSVFGNPKASRKDDL